MKYLTLLYADEARMAVPGSPEFFDTLDGYVAFAAHAGDAILAGDALHASSTARTVRPDGEELRVTAGPFAETTEVLGGYYVLEADSLDDVVDMVRRIPVVAVGGAELRPMAEFVANDEAADGPRWLATMHGPSTDADVPGSEAWNEALGDHVAFAEKAGASLVSGGALQPPDASTTVRVRDGEVRVSDGPYAEVSEVVGGYYVLTGTDDAVAELAGAIPLNPGGAVEVRPVVDLGG